jgi:starvation-inducible DNA-binding protein
MATAIQARLFKTSIDLPEPTRLQMIELLNSSLADMADLQTHAEHAHWNVKGPQFLSLHELFEQIASRLQQQADDVAERITALGGVAQGTARQIAAASNLPQYDLDAVSGEDHLRALAKRLSLVGGRIRAGVAVAHQLGDDATGDLLTEIVRQADKDLWLLEAHLQEGVSA